MKASEIYKIRWLPCENAFNAAIPPFSLVIPVELDSSGNFTVSQPNVDNLVCAVTNGFQIAATDPKAPGHGAMTFDFPSWVAYDNAGGDPNIGDTWGAKANSWLLTKGKTGFNVVGVDKPNTRAMVVPCCGSGGGGTITGAWGTTGATVNSVQNAWVLINSWGGVGGSPAGWGGLNTGLFKVPNGQSGTYECIGSVYFSGTDPNSNYTCDFGVNGNPAALYFDRGGACSLAILRCMAQQILALNANDQVGLYAKTDFNIATGVTGVAVSIKRVPGG